MILLLRPRSARIRAMYPGEDEGADGLYWPDTVEIALRGEKCAARQAEVLIHEIIHAIWDARKMGKRVTEESACTQLGVALAEIIRDNPEVMAALGLALTEGVPIVGAPATEGTLT